MYINSAYLGEEHEEIVDIGKPVLVTAAGYYRVKTRKIIRTERPHGRQDYQLLYVAEGKAHFHFQGVERVVPKGHMVLFRPGETQIYYLYAADKPETYWVHFTGGEVESLLDHYRMPREEAVFFTGSSADYQWLFRQMIQELQLRRANYEDLLRLNLSHILLIINRYMQEGHEVGSEMLNEIERATHYFNENYNQNINIGKYAEEHLMTANWFTQNFKKITKFTPMQYIVSLRLTNAMNLMDSTDYTMTQIAAAVGYDNSLYFSRLFKKHIGMTPTEYRYRNRTSDR